MKRNLLFLSLAALAASGCSIPKHYPSYDAQLAYAMQSTLEPVVSGIEGLSREDRVAIVNLDAEPPEDSHLQAMIDDALVNALLKARITVVERDSEGLRKVVQEGSGDNLKYTVTSHTEDDEGPMVFDARLVTGGGPTRYLVNGGRVIYVPPDTALLDVGPDGGDDSVTSPSPTSLNNEVVSASKIVAYRVIDVGIRDFKYKKTTYRFANVVMHVRVIDANYGTVVWAGKVEEVVEDEIPAIMAPKLRRTKDD
ncbi:MAG: hypothetical protein H6739_00370 [Alphaproteobacteria bacterium]|nr:hypothetical protein [Alphaproteobacteria bacterium]